MCTLAAVTGRYLFKTRDLWVESDPREEIVSGHGRLRYVGVRGHVSPQERGLNSGINAAGVAVAITYVDTVPLAEALQSRTPRGVLVEEILASCTDLSAALGRVGEYLQTPLVGGNIVIMTPAGGAVVEQLHPRFAVELVTAPFTVRSNHFLNLTVPGLLYGNRENSRARFTRMSSLVNGLDAEQAELAGIKPLLADHSGAEPICSHSGELRTVSAAVYDLAACRLHHVAGPPCSATWQEYGP